MGTNIGCVSSGGEVDLDVEQGARYDVTLTYTDDDDVPVNLLGLRGHMQIRRRRGTPVLVDLTTENGGLTIHAVEGEIDIYIGATVTAGLPRLAKYDLHLIGDTLDDVDRVFGGSVRVTPGITVDTEENEAP